MDKYEAFRTAAKEFAEKAQKLSSVLEIDIVGSVAGHDPYANDIDLAIVVSNLDEIETIAKYARQMSKYNPSWDVFVFNKHLKYLGRVCYRKECPTLSVDCSVPRCGEPPHLMVIHGFKYNAKKFFKSPIEVLWTTSGESRLLSRQKELGIVKPREYPVLQDIELTCIICGKKFVFSAVEQKQYKKMGFKPPKRCPECKMRQKMDEWGVH